MAGRSHPYPRSSHPTRPPPGIDDPRRLRHHQQREIQSLLTDNQRLAATHVALKQELAAADQELHHLSSTAAKLKADCDARVLEVHEKFLGTEAELRSVYGLNAELAQVKEDVEKMKADRKEFTSKLRVIAEEMALARSELEQFPSIEEELETMREEIKRGRAAVEYEKKMHANNLEQSQILEKTMISMTHEIEKLHIERANAENRVRAAAAAAAETAAAAATTLVPAYASVYATPEAAYVGNLYPEHYPMQQVPVVQGSINANPQYGPGVVPHGQSALYDIQLSNVHN